MHAASVFAARKTKNFIFLTKKQVEAPLLNYRKTKRVPTTDARASQ